MQLSLATKQKLSRYARAVHQYRDHQSDISVVHELVDAEKDLASCTEPEIKRMVSEMERLDTAWQSAVNELVALGR